MAAYFDDVSGDNDTSIVSADSSGRRGGGDIPMLLAKTPTNVIKLNWKKVIF